MKLLKRLGAAIIALAVVISAALAGFAPYADAATLDLVRITESGVVLRSDASDSSVSAGKASVNSTFPFVSEKFDDSGTLWYSVLLPDGSEAWVSSMLSVKSTESSTHDDPDTEHLIRVVVISSSSVIIRTAPGLESAALATVFRGETFTVLDHANDSKGTTWYEIQYGTEKAWVCRTNVTMNNLYKKIPNRVYSNGDTPVIYLSPSVQTANSYASGKTNESEQMYRVANTLAGILRAQYGCIVFMDPDSLKISKYQRPQRAADLGADVYLAIHSNAGGNGCGPQGYFFPGCDQSYDICENITEQLKADSPFTPNVPNLVNGMLYYSGTGYGEVRDPGGMGMVSALIEVEFHDKVSYSNWIIDHTDDIAHSIALGIVKTFNLSKVSTADYIRITSENPSVKTGCSMKLEVESNQSISWSSENPSIAKVSSDGTVTGVKAGITTITAVARYAKTSKTIEVVPDISISMLGASIRLAEPYGIRFGIQILKNSAFKSSSIVEYGTLIIGSGNLSGGELTIDTDNVLKITAKKQLSDDGNQLTYTGVLTNIPESFFDTNVTARGYLIYKMGSENRVVYTDTIERSFNEVVNLAYESYSAKENPTAQESEWLKKLEALRGQIVEVTDEP